MTITADQVQAISSVATFLAACVAVWATFGAPKVAARFAEKLRAGSQREDEERRLKLAVFTTMMQYRATYGSPSCVPMMNLIDVVFIRAPLVRAAWRHFMEAANSKQGPVLNERYRAILERMAQNLGIEEQISVEDIARVYYPQGMADLDDAIILETKERLARLRGQGATEPVFPPIVDTGAPAGPNR